MAEKMTHPDQSVHLGTIGAAHGTMGEVRVKSFTDIPTDLGAYGTLHDDKGRAFEIETIRLGKNVVIARFKGVKNRNDAEALNGVKLYIARNQLPADLDEDEFYQADLIGLKVRDDTGKDCGKVMAFFNFGAGDLLEISVKGARSVLIPFSLAAVPVVDVKGGFITIDLRAAGLIADEKDQDGQEKDGQKRGESAS